MFIESTLPFSFTGKFVLILGRNRKKGALCVNNHLINDLLWTINSEK